jgi:phosphate transport system protein
MFKKILSLWAKQSLMKRALEHTEEMFKITRELFVVVSEGFLENKPITYDIYKRDQEINRYEMQIRRDVLEHLAINPREDVLAALIMTGVVGHIERIGDYSKNIYELIDLYGKPFDNSRTHDMERKLYDRVNAMFGDTQIAFFQGDPVPAQKVIDAHGRLKKDCDAFIKVIAKSDSFETGVAVVSVLATRHFKRVSAHLFNIASTVVNPFDLIGYTRAGKDD